MVDMGDLTVGTAGWVERTSGRLTTAERRALLRPLARTSGQIAVGRLRLAVGVHPGRDWPPRSLLRGVQWLVQ